MHLPEIDKYSKASKPLHLIDPRIKLVCLFLLLLAVNLSWKVTTVAVLFFFSVLLLTATALPLRFVLWHLKAPLLLALLLFTVLSVTSGKTTVYGPITEEGVKLGLTVFLKVTTCFVLFLAFVATSPIFKTVQAAKALGVPEKLLAVFVFTYRYTFVLLDGLKTLEMALLARGFKEKTSLSSYKTKAKLYAYLFVRAFEETEKVLLAMYARGFVRVSLSALPPIRSRDLIKGLPLLFSSVVLLFVSIFG